MKNWAKTFLESNTMNAYKSTFMESEGIKYLFLDFDDTIREVIPYESENGPPVEVSQVKVFPGVGKAIKTWKNNGWNIVGVTNQKGSLRRLEFVPEEMRDTATLEDAAAWCGKVVQETLSQLGINFPVLFCSDATVFLCEGGKVSSVGKFGEEAKNKGNAPKPSPVMGEVAFKLFGTPDLSNSFMIGDSYEGADENFSKAIGFQWLHPGPLGRDFVEYTREKFGEELEETGGVILDVPFYGTHKY